MHATRNRIRAALLIALTITAISALPALAAWAYSSFTGPTVLANNGNGTWNVRWTITVTQMNGDDNNVCLTTNGTVGACTAPAGGGSTGVWTCDRTVSGLQSVSWDISSYSGLNCGTKKTQGPTGTMAPLSVSLAAFEVQATADDVQLTWETVSEQDNAGFNVYRGAGPEGPWTQVNVALIFAKTPGSTQGNSYGWLDTSPVAGESWYLLEDVDVAGATVQHGPVAVGRAQGAGPNAVQLSGLAAGGLNLWPVWGGLLALAGLAGVRQLRRR